MSGFTKKDQDKSLFTVKKDSQGNTIVMRASGENGGEIRGSILRTNNAKPFLVPGKGIKINSGSKSEGYPGPGQVELSINVSEIAGDIREVASRLGLTGTAGPRGATGATGAQGAVGPAGDTGPAGADGDAGPAGADGIDGVDGADGADGIDGADGADGFGSSPGDYFSFKDSMQIISNTVEYPAPSAGSGSLGTPSDDSFLIARTVYDGSFHSLSSAIKELSYHITFSESFVDNAPTPADRDIIDYNFRIFAKDIPFTAAYTAPSSTGTTFSSGDPLITDNLYSYNKVFDPDNPAGSDPTGKFVLEIVLDMEYPNIPVDAAPNTTSTITIYDAYLQTKYTVP